MVAQDWEHAGTLSKKDIQSTEDEQETPMLQLHIVQWGDGEGNFLQTKQRHILYIFATFSILVSGCIQFTLFGAGTVYLILSSQIFQELLSSVFPNASFCFWFILIAIVLTPPMWLGSPKDFS